MNRQLAPSNGRTVERRDRNGVRVKVTRGSNGSVVEADCHCYGIPGRLHSTPDCVVLKKKKSS